jgi:hypothetical protein
MQSAQLRPEHTAQLSVMQAAYASLVAITSGRHLRRQANLERLVAEFGGATALAVLAGTPKTHISAMQAGKRGMGDALAAKFERKCEKPAGWMDQDHAALSPPTAQPRQPVSRQSTDFHARDVSESDWALLDDIKTAATDEELKTIRSRAAIVRELAARQMARMAGASAAQSEQPGDSQAADDATPKRKRSIFEADHNSSNVTEIVPKPHRVVSGGLAALKGHQAAKKATKHRK